MFKHSSSTSGLLVALCLVFSITFSSFPTTRSSNVIAQTGRAPKSAPTSDQQQGSAVPTAKAQPQRTPVPNSPQAAVITATLTDSVTAATKVAPGGTINYTAVITNNGAASPADDATNLNFSAPLDANTTLVGGSIHASPIAFNDTYNWVGNTFLDTSARALPSASANDVAVNAPAGTDAFTVTAIAGGATALGGVVTLASPSGHFTYTPPLNRPNLADGATVQDSFTYTITNSADPTLTSTGTVRINLTGRVFYLQAGAAGDGRSNTPSSSPAAMCTAADKSTDVFYIFSNAASLNGPFSVDAGQQLLGQGVNLVVSSITLFTAAAPTPTTTNTAGTCVALAGAPGNNTVSGFNIGNCTGGAAVTGANVGTLNVSTLSINTNGGALDLTGVGSPTVSVVLGGTTSTAGAKNVNLVGLNGTITLGSGALSGATGNAFDVNGGTAAVTYSGTISNSGAKQVNIANKTGGSVALSGVVQGTGTGINLATNTGATISFTGGVILSTSTSAAFSATGGGTVNVTDPTPLGTAPDNTLTTTTGTALTVTNTTIGASGLNFRSISSNGAANGIFLNNTGGSGGLNVTGDGSNTTKGGNGSGGTIQNSTGADATTNGIAIYLNNTSGAQLRRITVSGTTQNNGVYAESVTNLTMQYCNIGGTIGTTSGSNDLNLECPVEFGKTSPSLANGFANGSTSTVDNCLISGGIQHNFEVYQTTNTASLTISNSNITNNGAALGSDGINIETTTSANLTVSVQTCLFDNNKSQALQASSLLASTLDLTVNGCTIQKTTQGNEGFVIQNAGTSHLTAHVTSNTFTGILGTNILVGQVAGNAGSTSNLIGVIKNNNITVGAVGGPYPINRTLIVFLSSTTGQVAPANILVDINTINTQSDPASGIAEPLFVSTPDANTSPSFTATVLNNVVNINDPAGTSLRGIAVQSTQTTSAGCIDVRGNDVNYTPAPPAGINGIRVRQVNPATLQMEQGASAGAANVVLAANNPLSTTEVVGTVAVVGNSTCQTAPTIAQPIDDSARNRNEVLDSSTSMYAMAQVRAESATVPVAPVVASISPARPSYSATLGDAMHHAFSTMASAAQTVDSMITPTAYAQDSAPNAPTSGENVTLNTIATFPAGGKSITIKYSATVNTPPLARSVQTQGTVTANAGAISVLTTDPETGTAVPTKTNIDTLMTWNGATSTDWNTATNWTQPAGGTQYAPGVSNSAVNDVVIPNVGAQPNISATDIGVFSLNIVNGRTLTITSPRVLTIGGAPGGDLTLDGIISGGNLNLGTGTHVINNAGGTGSLSSTNVATVLSGSTVTLGNNLQAGALAVNAGGSMNITNRTLSLNGSGAALTIPGGATFTTTGSTVIFNGTAAQTAAGIAYNNLTINNTIGLNVTGVTLTGNATVNGALALTSSDLDAGAFTLTQPNTTASTGVSDVVGKVSRTGGPFAPATPLTFGNPNNRITFTAPGTKPTDVTVNMAKAAPATYAAAVQRNYTISQTGGVGFTSTLRLHYLDGELNGNVEANLNLRRGPSWSAVLPSVVDQANNWVECNAVTAFSQWTFSSLVPTAAGGVVTGRIVGNNGDPVAGAVVRLNGTQNRKFITDANGFYRFDGVETNGFYTVTPSRANYNFNPFNRSFTQLGNTTEAIFAATSTGDSVNPLDTPEYFVRQQYVDLLGREPEEDGFNYWSDRILECGGDALCVNARRRDVAAGFFIEAEFQQTGSFIYGFYKGSLGRSPAYAEFSSDRQLVIGGPNLEKMKQAYAESFIGRAEFVAKYQANMTAESFVNALLVNVQQASGIDLSSQRDALTATYNTGANLNESRSLVVRVLTESADFRQAEYNAAFVLTEYFGYLRRDAELEGYNFWLDVLNNREPGNFRGMVCSFITSREYQQRFSAIVSHSNQECGQ